MLCFIFFFQAEDGIRDKLVTGVQTCALPICPCGAPTGRCDLRPPRQAPGSRRRAVLTRGPADRPGPGPEVLPAVRPRLRGAADRPDEDPAAAFGKRPERPVPPRSGGAPRGP